MKFINPYLNFNGNTEEVFTFYRSVLGGEFAMVMRFRDTEGCEHMPEDEKDGIMHIALPVGSSVIMGTDVPKSMEQVVNGTSVSLCVHMDSREEADRIFNGLSEGGKVTMPMEDMFWGDYFGSFFDKYGIQWMISFSTQDYSKM
ncbi:VOC family protein [Flavobacterium sp. DGU11]|uniref:VOC family protein n=1 Tax=Flavobacterium arundinis TaxID=3139143 RepID=A0ABU9HV04_9FLAO